MKYGGGVWVKANGKCPDMARDVGFPCECENDGETCGCGINRDMSVEETLGECIEK